LSIGKQARGRNSLLDRFSPVHRLSALRMIAVSAATFVAMLSEKSVIAARSTIPRFLHLAECSDLD
jgi:hypothetical protein